MKFFKPWRPLNRTFFFLNSLRLIYDCSITQTNLHHIGRSESGDTLWTGAHDTQIVSLFIGAPCGGQMRPDMAYEIHVTADHSFALPERAL